MDKQRQNDQSEPIHNSSVLIQVIVLKTSLEQWTIETGDERWSGRSMLAAQHDDNDDSPTNASSESNIITSYNNNLSLLDSF